MLEILRCSSPGKKREYFANFEPRTGTWVVSDLQSKWHLQKELLRRHGVLEENAVLRATELWKQFAFQLRPEIRLLSPELAQTLFWDWIEPMELPWARTPRAVPVVLQQMQMWMTMFSDPQAPEIMAQWFSDQPESFVRWGHWFELCAELWQRCQEKHLMMVAWLPAMLLGEDLKRLHWKRTLTFDLGPQISQVEGLLLRELGNVAESGEVRAIYPEAPWLGLMPGSLRPYEVVLPTAETGTSDWQPPVRDEFHFERFSTQLAEVKDAVANVRTWLDAGVPAQKIALVAPDIEEYWPVLRLYLQQEGIAACKPQTARLGGFTEMARWLATLRTAMAQVTSQDLEILLFSHREQPRLSFEDFRVLFLHVYDAGDLDRAQALFAAELQPAPVEAQSLHEFLPWALRFWDASHDSTRLLTLLQVLGREVPGDVKLRSAQWLSYFEGLLSRRELTLRPAHEAGVWCVSLSSANWLDVSHGVMLNLSEGALRQVLTSQISASESQKIFTDTGFALGSPDRQELEFDFLWLLQNPWKVLHLSFAGTDFSGNVMTPSRLWMWTGFLNNAWKKDPQAPKRTRWDEIQRQPLPALGDVRQWRAEQTAGLQLGLERDLRGEISTWQPIRETRISASSLESYLECPFIFAANRQLRLSDDPVLDLDLDRRTRGNLLHALLDRMLGLWTEHGDAEEGRAREWNPRELAALVDEVRTAQNIKVGDERLWPSLRAQHVYLLQLFLRFESEWRRCFPRTQTVGREAAFTCYWDVASARPVREKPEGDAPVVMLSGRLDRLDRDSHGRYALIDYKASSQGLRNWNSWMRNHDLQMALYAVLVESGLTEFPAAAVVAANYYVVRESDRRKGFHFRDPAAADGAVPACELFASDAKHRNWIDAAAKTALFDELRAQIQKAVQGILRGDFNPAPEDVKICERCSWRTLCRAPHLN